MNFSKQLKKYREKNDFSQERLAEKIYVSRQTVSKWENDKSYPDIHNLIALSVLFDISLDELVKGDVSEMKNQLKNKQVMRYGWCTLVFLLLSIATGGIGITVWDYKGFIPMAIFWAISMYFAFRVKIINKQYNLKTYREIIAFAENRTTTLENLQKNRNQKKLVIQQGLFIIGCGVIAMFLMEIVMFITSHVLN